MAIYGRTSDLRSRGRWFESQSEPYQVFSRLLGWVTVCGQFTDKPSRYITNTKVNWAFRPHRVGKLSIGDLAGFETARLLVCRVADNTVSYMAGDAP